MLFWQPPSEFSQRSPSSFVVDNVSYSCAEQFMMEKARLFQDCRAEELNMSSPDPSKHKRIGRGVRNFDIAVLEPRSRRRRPRWQLCQVLTEPDNETAPSEHWHQTFG